MHKCHGKAAGLLLTRAFLFLFGPFLVLHWGGGGEEEGKKKVSDKYARGVRKKTALLFFFLSFPKFFQSFGPVPSCWYTFPMPGCVSAGTALKEGRGNALQTLAGKGSSCLGDKQ